MKTTLYVYACSEGHKIARSTDNNPKSDCSRCGRSMAKLRAVDSEDGESEKRHMFRALTAKGAK